MSDILQIATARRTNLKAELTKLEEFLAMAEEQLAKSGLRPDLRTRAVKARADAKANIAELERDGRGR